ncbi:hypothetical protein BDP81DRAFT_145627 [Colletotrichum phormii]|uniref:Secreted protein n=1 Tax=Colletotrichum phormii TaxID=359342 RepID=A0AAJ0EAG0_9PEZI|nr:uncharacterized protein BDP81DRAFT_145627 [Colletotrichum phormii]KAK1622683.1 hypothetical protein BDP81DRAFT_145627 [Colletotrichum phormii]
MCQRTHSTRTLLFRGLVIFRLGIVEGDAVAVESSKGAEKINSGISPRTPDVGPESCWYRGARLVPWDPVCGSFASSTAPTAPMSAARRIMAGMNLSLAVIKQLNTFKFGMRPAQWVCHISDPPCRREE